MRDLQDAAFLAQLRKGISDAHVHPTTGYGGNYSIEFLPTEDHGTTHLSVVDNEGNAVALPLNRVHVARALWNQRQHHSMMLQQQ